MEVGILITKPSNLVTVKGIGHPARSHPLIKITPSLIQLMEPLK